MNAGPCQLGVRIFQKAGLHSKTDPVIWSLNMKTACKTFFQASDKRVGPSFALVSRLHCAGSCISPVLFTWVIPFEFGATMRMCKVTHMLSVSFIYWNDVGLVFFHLMVQPSNYWHQGYSEPSQLLLLFVSWHLCFPCQTKMEPFLSMQSIPAMQLYHVFAQTSFTWWCKLIFPIKELFVLSFSSSHDLQSFQLCHLSLSHTSLSWLLPYRII